MTKIKKLKINHRDSRGLIMDIFEKKKLTIVLWLHLQKIVSEETIFIKKVINTH